MSPELTPDLLELLRKRIAMALEWHSLAQIQRDVRLRQAAAILADLDELGVSGAAISRAVEKICTEPVP